MPVTQPTPRPKIRHKPYAVTPGVVTAYLKSAGHIQSTKPAATHRGGYRTRYAGFIVEKETDNKTCETFLVVRYEKGAYWRNTAHDILFARKQEAVYVETLRHRYTVEERTFPAWDNAKTGATFTRWVVTEKPTPYVIKEPAK